METKIANLSCPYQPDFCIARNINFWLGWKYIETTWAVPICGRKYDTSILGLFFHFQESKTVSKRKDIIRLKMATNTVECEYHPDHTIEYFCRSHDDPCCEACKMADHELCVDVVDIESIISIASTHGCHQYQIIQEKLQKCLENFVQIPTSIAKNLSRLDQDKVIFKNTITCYRRKVESHLDFLENGILKEYDKIYEAEHLNLKKLEKEITNKISKIEKCLSELREISEQTVDVPAIISLRNIARENSKKEDFLKSFYADDNVVSIDFTMTKEILTFQDIPSLGSLQLKRSALNNLQKENQIREDEIEGQNTMTNLVEPRYEIVETLNINLETDEIEIIDLKKINEDVLVMTDRLSENIIIYNLIEDAISKITVGEKPDCIAVVDKNTIAVTQGKRNVVLIDVPNRTVLNCFDMKDKVEGLTNTGNQLVVNCTTNGLQILDMSGKSVGTIPNMIGRLYLHATNSRQIICSDQVNNKVTCINLNGDIIFSFADDRLISPYGLTMDNNGHIFIVCIDSESIFEMRQDGSKVTRLLSKKYYLKRPYVILYLNDGSFLVSNESGRSVVRYKLR